MCILKQQFRLFIPLLCLTSIAVLGFTFSFFDGRSFWDPDLSEKSDKGNDTNETSLPPSLPDFVRPGSKCNVPLGPNRAHLPPCTHSLFRLYYSKMASFPECGAWVETEGYSFSQRYILDFCEFKPYSLPECSLRNGLYHILILGDSQGWRTYLSMVNTTIWAGSNCHLVKTEGIKSRTPSADYFSLGRKSLNDTFVIADRGCVWCRAAVYDCEMHTESGFHTVRLEFSPAYKFKDPSLSISPGNTNWRSAETFQEFLFSTYLPMTGMPDAIVMPMPLNHELWNYENVTSDVQSLVDVIIKYVPRSTQVHWMPTASTFPSKRQPENIVHNLYTYGKDHILANPMIYRLTTQITKVLEPYLLDSFYNMYGFVGLFNMSSAKEDWNEEAIHFNYLWYAHVIRTLLSILCAG
ncbi:hypothetical protein CAPTEDRAFT_185082 [Capitella teleta]|uniref:Uncharacterized protein n=1 Tax=Capitella teleta TaxID=283909 RepID=R7TWV7_CAPTE|nr:hypothetical protein CAPTEDRAFT_185082 [Capitella teleta]|eukprot:ELT98224.1 hypothetical protein CAPTEDRAFT_185082 [Capitella teleta]